MLFESPDVHTGGFPRILMHRMISVEFKSEGIPHFQDNNII